MLKGTTFLQILNILNQASVASLLSKHKLTQELPSKCWVYATHKIGLEGITVPFDCLVFYVHTAMLRKDSYSSKNLRPNCSGCLNSFMIMSAGHSTLYSSSFWRNTKKSNHADTSSISLCQLDIFSVSYNKCQELWWLETMEDAICALANGSPLNQHQLASVSEHIFSSSAAP